MKSLIILSMMFSSLPMFARSGRGAYKTNVKCNIKSYSDARACMVRLANYMPTGNDENAALVTRSKVSKTLMNELLEIMGETKDQFYVNNAKYLAAVVQNDDEESIYYYALSNGLNVTPKLLGSSVAIVDFVSEICYEDDASLNKFMNPRNLFLGMDHNKSLNGTIWFADDMACY